VGCRRHKAQRRLHEWRREGRRVDNENMRKNRLKVKKVTDWNGIDGKGYRRKIVQIGERDEDNGDE
jgi:hypothetical protein